MDIKCDQCDEIATVHFTQIIKGKKCASHLCDWCMANRPVPPKNQFNFPALLQALLGQNELAQAVCPCCDIGFMEFRGHGRLGCPNDYHVFHQGLVPLLKRIHSKVRHMGKRPSKGVLPQEFSQKLLLLRKDLSQAVASENYEKAGVLTRQIRLLQDNPPQVQTQESPRNES